MFKRALAVLLCAASAVSMAASDGDVGRTSQGSFEITLKVNPYVQIKDLEDVFITEASPEVTQTFTILSNQEHYRINVDHGELTNGQDSIPYDVDIYKNGRKISDLSNVPHDMKHENVPNRMAIKVDVESEDIKNARQGDYRDTVTITVAVK